MLVVLLSCDLFSPTNRSISTTSSSIHLWYNQTHERKRNLLPLILVLFAKKGIFLFLFRQIDDDFVRFFLPSCRWQNKGGNNEREENLFTFLSRRKKQLFSLFSVNNLNWSEKHPNSCPILRPLIVLDLFCFFSHFYLQLHV